MFLSLTAGLLLAAALPGAHAFSQGAGEAGTTDIIQGDTDHTRRLTVPVRLENQGPFDFLIDTGSQTTVVSSALANQLALQPSRPARIIGVGGVETVDTAIIEELHLGRKLLVALEVPMLERRHIGADGILGLDSLQGQRVLLDFTRNVMAVGEANALGGNKGFDIIVTARSRSGQLIMTNAIVDGIKVDVVIDTGSDATIGNLALQRAVGHRNASAEAMLTSVTGQQIMARVAYPRKLSIGELDINNIAIAYADSPVFETLALNRRPAMLLGMSELRLFKRVAIDFNTRKVFFDLPPSR